MTVTQDEVDRLIAYENGEAIRLTIQKLDNTTFRIIQLSKLISRSNGV